MHGIDLLVTIAASLGIALVLGYITHRLGMSPIVGYLLAGIAVGPHTPGLVADVKIASHLAEVGVVLLMFGVGLQFHWKDLLAVKAIAVPGAVGQSITATALGVAVAMAFGWSFAAGLVLGIAMSVASTVVLIRVLSDNDVLATPPGHAAVGWLVVEDIFTVIVLIWPRTARAGSTVRRLRSMAVTIAPAAPRGTLTSAYRARRATVPSSIAAPLAGRSTMAVAAAATPFKMPRSS